jgi:tripartite-type tricarboxylate transporter receptor subunit TctC
MNKLITRAAGAAAPSNRREVLRYLGVISASLAAGSIAGSGTAEAAWPERTIKIVVPFGPGGPPDVAARVIADQIGPLLGTNAIVENRPGAGSATGVTAVARAEPDGYTLLVCTSAFIVNKVLNEQLAYDPVKDFTPLTEIATAPNIFVVNAKLGVDTIKDFVALSQSRPDGFNYSSPGTGTTPQLSSELLKVRAGARMTHIPYNNGPLAVQALLSGLVQFSCMSASLLMPHIEAGTLKALAVTSKERWSGLPNVPTMRELGYNDFVVDTMLMLAGPANLPADVTAKLADAARQVLKEPAVRQALERASLDVVGGSPSELAVRIGQDMKLWTQIATAIGLKKT